MATSVEEVISRFKKAQARKAQWDVLHEDAMDFVAPNREIFHDITETKGQDKNNTDQVFDSTAMIAVQTFVSNLQSGLVPPMKQWVTLKAGRFIPEEQKDQVDRLLEEITKIMFDFIRMSNFDSAMAESFHDLAFGVGALLINKGTPEKPLQFTSINLAQLSLEEGPNSTVQGVFRKTKLPLRVLDQQWEDATLPDNIIRRRKANPDEEVVLIEATIPAKITVVDKETNEAEIVDGFEYQVILEVGNKRIVKREQRVSPWVIFRWPTLPGEIWARGPVIKSLPDIKTLNKTKELLLAEAGFKIFGMHTYLNDGVINPENIKWVPGGFIPVDETDGPRGKPIDLIPMGGDTNLAQLIISDLQNAINRNLFGSPLGDVNLPVKTATEQALRQQELSKLIGSAFGRLQFELIEPLVRRILFILEEFQLIDLQNAAPDGRLVAIDIISPLAMVQDQETTTAMMRYAETMVGLFGPELGMAMIKPEEFAKILADNLGVPKDIVPSDQEIQVMKQALQARAAQEAQATQAEGQPEAA